MGRARDCRTWLLMLVGLTSLALLGCAPDGDGGGGPNGGGSVTTMSLEVDSTPGGARITVDGRDTGLTTPAVVTGLNASEDGIPHAVRLDLNGYHTYGTVVTLFSRMTGNTPLVRATLMPRDSREVVLSVRTVPPGARVVVDSRATGLVTPAVIDGLGPTRHTLRVDLAGYRTRTEVVDLTGKTEDLVVLQLTREGRSAISGSVIDLIGGGLVVGATVTIEGSGQSRTTSAQGTYVFENLKTGYYDLLATKRLVDGTELLGRRESIYVDPENGRMMTADIVMAQESEMGRISGTVRDEFGRGIANAYVYLDMIRAIYFAPVSQEDGSFSFVDIPESAKDKPYYVIASAPGYSNGATEVALAAGQHLGVNLRLQERKTDVIPAAPLVDWSQALTYPVGDDAILSSSFAIRRIVADRQPDASRRVRLIDDLERTREAGVRAFPPAGFVIENDIAWDTNEEPDLAGYRVRRSLQESSGFETISIIWDPNAPFMADISPELGPRTIFYYNLLAFNLAGDESAPSEWLSARPLDALRLVSPWPGETPDFPVGFAWESVPGADVYEILVFDRRPDYDSFGQTGLVWDNGKITANQTSITYGSGGEVFAPLESGREYYVAMIAGDGITINDSDALSFSSVVRFIAP
jgi:hypothetical protein